MRIVVHPHAVYEPQRLHALFFTLSVILVKGVIEVVVKNGVNSQGVCAHLLNKLKPAHICFLIYRVVGSPFSRQAHAHIHAPNFKRHVLPVPLHVNGVRVGCHEGSHRRVRVKVDVYAQPVICRVPCKKEQHDNACDDDKFFHVALSFRQWLNFLFLESWLYCKRMSMFSSIHAPRSRMKSFSCSTACS